MEIALNRGQKAQLKPLKALLDDAPGGTSTLAQVIWKPSGECVVKVALVCARPFRRIWEIADKPDALYRPPNNAVHLTPAADGSSATSDTAQPASG